MRVIGVLLEMHVIAYARTRALEHVIVTLLACYWVWGSTERCSCARCWHVGGPRCSQGGALKLGVWRWNSDVVSGLALSDVLERCFAGLGVQAGGLKAKPSSSRRRRVAF